jgi:hypothetical protein
MNITLHIRLEEFPDSPHIVGTSGTPTECIAWMKGFLAEGVIVDRMMVLGK